MATAYIDSAGLADLIGAKILATAVQNLGANLEAVIAAVCATVDGYVLKQVPMPPTSEAIAQVAPIAAELVYTALYINSQNAEITKRRQDAMRTLRDISTGVFSLHTAPVADDPTTPQDESEAAGPACGSAPRRMTRAQLEGW